MINIRTHLNKKYRWLNQNQLSYTLIVHEKCDTLSILGDNKESDTSTLDMGPHTSLYSKP